MASRTNSSALVTLLTIVVVVAVLYWASAVAIPLAVAVLLSFLLAPLVIRLQRLGIGRIAAVSIVAFLSFIALGFITGMVAVQVVDLAGKLPEYRHNIRSKIESLKVPGGGVLAKASDGIKEITQELLRTSDLHGGQGPLSYSPPAEPVPVVIAKQPPASLEVIRSILAPLVNPLVNAGIVLVFVVFMLIVREDLRDRFIRLAGQGHLTVTTQAIDEAARRVSRYLLMQLLVNATYGIPVAIGLYLIGLPNAILWGVLAILLRYLPYVGAWIAALMPIVLSLAVFDDWTRPLLTIGLFVALEIVSNNVIEPWLYGSGTGVSAMAILVSAVFWTWLWGPLGLMLATPLTVCLVVAGRYAPQLAFLNVLLSDEPGLSPPQRLYQRLLAGDQDEAFRIVHERLKSASLLELYDDVLIPALVMSEHDRHTGELDEQRSDALRQSMRWLIEEAGEAALVSAQEAKASGESEIDPVETPRAQTAASAESPTPRYLCLPARNEADELAGMMLAQLLQLRGVSAENVPAPTLAAEMLELIDQRQPAAVCISATPPNAAVHARYLCKRLYARHPELRTVVGIWSAQDLAHASDRLKNCGHASVVGGLAQALEALPPK